MTTGGVPGCLWRSGALEHAARAGCTHLNLDDTVIARVALVLLQLEHGRTT
ncbi:hypothetical protein [Streptomyces flaveus]|uniref:hypothetical protein n=1 Tax=Streptomyces flaveus TaxID=66370 RepID=UPI00331869B0